MMRTNIETYVIVYLAWAACTIGLTGSVLLRLAETHGSAMDAIPNGILFGLASGALTWAIIKIFGATK